MGKIYLFLLIFSLGVSTHCFSPRLIITFDPNEFLIKVNSSKYNIADVVITSRVGSDTLFVLKCININKGVEQISLDKNADGYESSRNFSDIKDASELYFTVIVTSTNEHLDICQNEFFYFKLDSSKRKQIQEIRSHKLFP